MKLRENQSYHEFISRSLNVILLSEVCEFYNRASDLYNKGARKTQKKLVVCDEHSLNNVFMGTLSFFLYDVLLTRHFDREREILMIRV